MTAAELTEDFEEVIGDPADLGLGWDYSIFDVLADVLQRAQSLEPETLRDTFATTDLDCIYGHVTFQDNHVGYVPIVFGQWVADETWGVRKAIVAAGHVPEITEVEDMLPMEYD
jgi:branched-chain amino acid transport system substrate-binding protein